MSPGISKYFSSILRDYRMRRLKNQVRHDFFLFLILNFFLLFLLIPAEALWYFPAVLKSSISIVFSFNLIFLVLMIFRLRDAFPGDNKLRNEELLLQIGQKNENVRDKLLNHYQLAEKEDPLAVYAVEHFMKEHPAETFFNSYIQINIRRKGIILLVLSLMLIIELLLFPAPSGRLLHPGHNYEPENPYSLLLMPGDTSIFAYDSLQIQILRRAARNYKIELFRETEKGLLQEVLQQKNDSLFVLDLHRLQESRKYHAMLRRPHLFYPRKYPYRDSLSVLVQQRPQIRSLDFRVEAPAYSGIPPSQYQGNVERMRFLPGSNLQITATLSDSAGSSFLVFRSDTLLMQKQGLKNWTSLSPQGDGSLLLMFYNKQGIGIRNPLLYKVELDSDAYPILQIIRPEVSEILDLNEKLQLALIAVIKDDYGISDFRVRYRIHSPYSLAPDSQYYFLDIPFEKGTRLQSIVHAWSIDRFITPGSELHYYFELLDNDDVRGPKLTKSPLYYARFPTLGDLFERQNERSVISRKDLTQEVENSREIAEAIEKLRLDLLREGEIDWQKRNALEESLQGLEQSKRQLEELAVELEEQKRFLEENALFDESVLERFAQLQELMNELIDDELFDKLQELREKLQRDDMSNMEDLLKNFSDKAKQFEQSLDRMLEIFKRVQQEQRLQELNRRMKELAEQQMQFLEKAEQMSTEDAAASEREIAMQQEALEERSRESANLFEEEEGESFENFLEAMDSSAVSKDLQEARNMFLGSRRDQAMQKAHEASEKMQDLSRNFSEMLSSILQKQKEEISRTFRALLQKSIYISVEQEKTIAFAEDIDAVSPLLHSYSSRLGLLLKQSEDIGRHLIELSKKTFLVDKVLGEAMGQIVGNLLSGIGMIEDANISAGKIHIDKAFRAMNRLSRLLLERSEMAEEQQGNASGMEFYLQQLQQMAGEQQELNMGMPQPGFEGSPGSEGMMDQLARMAARQQALRRALKELAQEISDGEGGRRITGDLDRIAADMQEVIDQMRKNQVSRPLLMRQQQIVQRLLDASRSATSRDYKKERESKTATQIAGKSIPGLPTDLGERDMLLEQLRRAVQESDLTASEKRDMEAYLEKLIESAGIKTEEARP